MLPNSSGSHICELSNCFRCQRSMAAFSPPAHTEGREDGAGQVIYQLCFGSWTPLPASCLLFSTAEPEVGLHSVNLSLRGLRAFALVCRRTEERNERRVVKGRECIKEQKEKARVRARWAPSQSIYQTQCGPPLPSLLLSCPKPPCNSVMIFIII